MLEEEFSTVKTAHPLEHYKNHFEFLGYTVEEVDEFSIYCRHSRKDSLMLILLNQGAGVMAQMNFRFPSDVANDLGLLYMYANELNSLFYFIKAFVQVYDDSPPYLFLTSVCDGEYNRHTFAVFLENFNQDANTWHRYPKTSDIWKPKTV